MSIRTSEQTDELMGKLAIAQSKMGVAIKSNTAQAEKFTYHYADLSAIIDATLEHLNAVGIAVMQHPSFEYKTVADMSEAFVTITTRLQYGSQWMESDISLPALMRGRFDAQSCGSAITYGCRYALQSILVVPREDDDGQAATGRGTKEEAQAVARQKIAALREPQQPLSGNPDATDALFYAWNDENQTALITGAQLLLKLHKPYLKQFWSPSAQALVMNAEQLENAKYEFERRKTPFLKAPVIENHGD